MTARTKAFLRANLDGTIETAGENTALEVRTQRHDHMDTFATQAALDALIVRVAELEAGGGGGGTPTTTQRVLFVSADDSFSAAEQVLASPVDGQSATLPAGAIPTGQRRYIAIGRPAAEGDFTTVFFYPAGHRTTVNVLAGWTNVAAPIDYDGSSWHLLRTRGSQRDNANGFVVEAT